uniref:Bifunctional inhibitor/plant lipid transfer protein/seed storage helical domain-containing protein n=1 Tax=Oryza rufipogon TaxID=4529 RepID=A0A0E0NVJ7_ORYRU
MARQQLLGLFLVLAIMVAVVWGDPSSGCDQDRQDMIRECKKYEGWPAEPKIEPSEACCAVWQRANIPCLCAGVTKEKEKVWCMEKVVYVAKFCKKPFQPGYQCGSYTVPSSLGQ